MENDKLTLEEREVQRREHNKAWYKRTYDSLIEKARSRGLSKTILKRSGDTTYYELHHIIPRCLNGEDVESNLVLLTFREHIIAHKLLLEIYEDNILSIPVLLMLNGGNSRLKNVSSRQLEYYRIKYIEWKKSMRGKYHTEEHKKELSDLWKYNNPMSRKVKGPDEVIYNSLTLAAESINISPITLRKWIKKNPEKGWTYAEPPKNIKNYTPGRINPDIFIKIRKPVQGPDGTIYESINEAGRQTGHMKGTIRKWINNKPEKGWKFYNPEDSNNSSENNSEN